MAQVRAYLGAIERIERERSYMLLQLIAVGAQGTPQGIEALLKALQ